MALRSERQKFSVLMSVYVKENPEHFDLALKSILTEQTRKPDQFVLICDGPLTEKLDAVLERYSGAYPDVLHIVRLEQNGGLGRALNIGLKECENELVARADSDDICVSTRFEKQIGYLEQHPEIHVVGSSIDEFETDPRTPHDQKLAPQSDAASRKMAKFRNPMNHMTVAFRKTAIEAVGSYQPLKYLEDYYLWLRLLANGYQLTNLSEILVHARVGNGMLSRRGNKCYIDGWDELSKYKLRHKLINRAEKLENWLAVRAFIFAPQKVRASLYSNVLRQKVRRRGK